MKEITASEAFNRIDDDDFVVLDVREPFEVETASIEKYIHIPMGQIPQRMNELPKDKTIAVMCHHGGRSARVTMFLEQKGFDNVVNIEGGIEKWATDTSSNTPRYVKSFNNARVVS